MPSKDYAEEQRDYLQRLQAAPPSKSKEGLLGDAESALEAKYPYIYRDFLFLDEIGRGAYKRTRLIMNRRSAALHALKIVDIERLKGDKKAMASLKPEYKDNPAKAFEHEGMRMEQLKDDNSPYVSFPDLHGQQGSFYFFLEQYSERTLLDYIETNRTRHPLTIGAVKDFACQLAEGIHGIHSVELYHGDLHPANILFRNAELWIADFGMCSSMFGVDDDQKYIIPHSEVRPPELLQREKREKPLPNSANVRILPGPVDVWSFGITVAYMLFGKMPFPTGFNGSVEEWKRLSESERCKYRGNILNQIKDDKVYRGVLSRIDNALEGPVGKATKRSLEKNPRKRLANGVELREFLDAAGGGQATGQYR